MSDDETLSAPRVVQCAKCRERINRGEIVKRDSDFRLIHLNCKKLWVPR